MDVVHKLILGHLYVSYSYSQTEHLRQRNILFSNPHSIFTTDTLKSEPATTSNVAWIFSSQAYLLHLEFDGGFDLIHLGIHVFVVGEQGGELAGLVQPRAQDTRDLLDQRLRGQEGVVLLG